MMVSQSNRLRVCRGALLAGSVVMGIGVSLCFAIRPDAGAVVTVWPAWCWAIIGITVTAIAYCRSWRRIILAAVVLWIGFTLWFVEELRSLGRRAAATTREMFREPEQGKRLRVVSLNCQGGDERAVLETMALDADIVLLQESPRHLERIATAVFGHEAAWVRGLDASMIWRGQLLADLTEPRSAHIARARIRLRSGIETEVVSLRLPPPPFRVDIGSADCWRAYAADRRHRRDILRAIVESLESWRGSTPLIMGGDFNAPQGDAIFDLMRPRLRDAFDVAGMGWGNTIVNDLPVLRIDQIWISHQFQAVQVRALRTEHSDHRMVVCDLKLR